MVKILKKITETELEDIGDLDHETTLPCGEGTKCNHCGKKIEDAEFIFGFKKGFKNLAFHKACLNQGELFDSE